MSTVIQTVIRQLAIVLGTWLATVGVIEEGQVEALAGIIIVAAAFTWRYISLWLAKKAAK